MNQVLLRLPQWWAAQEPEAIRRVALALGLVLIIVLALPPLRLYLEADMRLHMLLQFPLLALTGALFACATPPRWLAVLAPWDRFGITGLVCAALVTTFWMIPKALDDALVYPWLDAAKFLSLSLGVGFALTVSWRRAGLMARGLFVANFFPMMPVFGWLYLVAPVRICNAYLPGQQESTGTWLVIVGIGGLVAWLGSWFIPARGDPAWPTHPVGHEDEDNERHNAYRLRAPAVEHSA